MILIFSLPDGPPTLDESPPTLEDTYQQPPGHLLIVASRHNKSDTGSCYNDSREESEVRSDPKAQSAPRSEIRYPNSDELKPIR